MPARPTHRARMAFGIVFVVTFPRVDSEWRGGWLQAAGGAVLLALPIGLATWGLADRSGRGRRILKSLLVLCVLSSLAGIYSYGVFTTPFLLAPLWLATNRARGPEAFGWIILAVPCALLTGWLLASSFELSDNQIPLMFTTLVVLLFSWTALRQWKRTGPNASALGEVFPDRLS